MVGDWSGGDVDDLSLMQNQSGDVYCSLPSKKLR